MEAMQIKVHNLKSYSTKTRVVNAMNRLADDLGAEFHYIIYPKSSGRFVPVITNAAATGHIAYLASKGYMIVG